MQRCGYCDCQSDMDHSEDEKEDHGSAQPAPPTKSRFHRLPPISTSRPLSRCHPPPAGVVLPGQIDGHTLLSAPIGSLFTRLRAVGPPRTPPAAAYKYRFLEKNVERKSISSTGERHGSRITIHSDILTSMKPLSCDTCAKNSRNMILTGYNRTMAEWAAHISNYPRGQS